MYTAHGITILNRCHFVVCQVLELSIV